MPSEIQEKADFSEVRYANCWEDPELLIRALEPAGRHCLSIGSAGDNSFSLLAAGAERVSVVEMNPAQVACIELRKAAYAELSHAEFLQLHGEVEGPRRDLFARCAARLPEASRGFWEARPEVIARGFGQVGKFESYFRLFRRRLLPLVHSRRRVETLLSGGRERAERARFFREEWNSWRWRALFRLFFSRRVMGLLGRDPAFFDYVEGPVADRIAQRVAHALIELDPAENPYLRWILQGRYGPALPHALRAENYEKIRSRLDALELIAAPLEEVLASAERRDFAAFNLSDIFEYMSEENTARLLEKISQSGRPGGRLAYWNMLAPRSRPDRLAERLEPLPELSRRLFARDQAFFYAAFVVEEIR